jgi:Enoyl-CoA hydratase/isomerase
MTPPMRIPHRLLPLQRTHRRGSKGSIIGATVWRQACRRDSHQQASRHDVYHGFESWAQRRKAIQLQGAPESIHLIPDSAAVTTKPWATIRALGCTRRILLSSSVRMTPDAVQGLAYRMRTLTRNESLNSVLLASDDRAVWTDNDSLPSLLLEDEMQEHPSSSIYASFQDPYTDEYHDDSLPPRHPAPVALGYDHVELRRSILARHENDQVAAFGHALDQLSAWAAATRGDDCTAGNQTSRAKIPVLVVPHGAVADGGSAILYGTYVVATPATTLQILTPTQGLSLDPTGLSYWLPRLGAEFRQPSARYARSCALLLACCGYQANAADLVETGLATHYVDSISNLASLERTLSELPPWNQQGLVKRPIQYLGDPVDTTDINAPYRNVGVASAIHCFASYAADGLDFINADAGSDDPSLIEYPDGRDIPAQEYRSSDLVNYAATFDDIFQQCESAADLYNQLQVVAQSGEAAGNDEPDPATVAQHLVRRLELASPLATAVTFRLVQLGAREQETFDSCVTRERHAQVQLWQHADFARHCANTSWTHASLNDVTLEEIEAIVGE